MAKRKTKEQKELEQYRKEASSVKNVLPLNPCYYCKHVLFIGKQESNEGWTCRAFPVAPIPWPLWSGHDKHDSYYLGQVGNYRYESGEFDNGEGYMEKLTIDGEWVRV